MSLKTNYFYVMYRDGAEKKVWEDKTALSEFKLIKNPYFHWVADPFPIVVDGKKYIFAEIMSRFTGKAAIGYVCLDDKKLKWKKCFNPPYHISFPNIYLEGDEILAMPETYQDHCAAIYSVSRKGFSWKKKKVVLSSPYCVDSCFDKDGKTILVTYENDRYCSSNPDVLFVRNYNNPSEILFSVVDNERKLRPAGNCFLMNDSLILPTQDNTLFYGVGVIFNVIDLKSKTIKPLPLSIYPSDIKDNPIGSKVKGFHTYNCCGDLEVIDVLLPTLAIRGLLHKIKSFLLDRDN